VRKLPPLNELRAFEAAARRLSFRDAAAELGVTPTAISHQIHMLERYCGLSLFRRRPRPMTLTEAGARLFPVVRDGLDSFSTIIATVKKERDRQPLRITTTNAFAGRWLVPRLVGWRKERPDIPLEVIGTDSVLDLEAGDADVAIRYAVKAPSHGPSIELLRDRFWPVCTPALASTMRSQRRARDLRGQVLIHCYWPAADRTAPTWQRWLHAAGKRWRDVPEFAELQHLSFREETHSIAAVIAGQGVGICSDLLVEDELMTGKLIKAFDLPLPGYGFFLVRTERHHNAKAVDAFSAWLVRQGKR
jgi:LysR family transcriptional regulator, glycine cleavage system transcriptional activator